MIVLKKLNSLNVWLKTFFIYICCVLIIACSQPEGAFFYGALGLGTPRILVSVLNTGNTHNVLLYDLNGRLLSVVWDSTFQNDAVKGIAPFAALDFALLLDGADRIARAAIDSSATSTISADSNLNGVLYQMAYDTLSSRFYAIEGNTIEAFTSAGSRVGAPYIDTTVGACVQNISRGVFADNLGRLYVVGTGNDRLLVYNVSTSASTCVTSNTALNTFDPIAVIKHSNGLLYVATQVNDQVYTFAGDGTGAATVVWATNLTFINNPTALLELPDGSILVASDGTNSIERISPAGVLLSPASFIRDSFTGFVTQMALIGGE